jgi:hypothetical protein
MQSFPQPDSPSKLSHELQHRLNMYALAAGAAGMGVLVAAAPADAKVVYTPAHKHVGRNSTVPVDLNNDGKTDFNIHQSFTCTSFCEYIVGALSAQPAQSQNEVLGHVGRYYNYASALRAGVHIGPKKKFFGGNKVMAYGGYDAGTTSFGTCDGDWVNKKHHYLGLRFLIKGKVHFGWARLNETCSQVGENTAVLTGYAYETEIKKAIVAGDTGMHAAAGQASAEQATGTTLGGLAKGSARVTAH